MAHNKTQKHTNYRRNMQSATLEGISFINKLLCDYSDIYRWTSQENIPDWASKTTKGKSILLFRFWILRDSQAFIIIEEREI